MLLLTLILLINCEKVLNINYVNDNPIIFNENGHLTIKTPKDKHIFLKTKGQGTIHVNEVDLKNISSISSSLVNTLIKYKQNFDITRDKIQKLETVFNEGIPRNSSLTTFNPYGIDQTDTITRIRRKLTGLNRKVLYLTSVLNANECASNPCKNGGTCQDLFNTFHCFCPKEWEGGTCELDVNECRLMGTDLGCQNGATCINKPGTYECSCTPGWFGMHCTQRSTDCNSGSSTELCGHGTCIPLNTKIGYKCLCNQGWKTDGRTLGCNVDVNECTENRPICSVNPLVSCINLPGTFRCGACPVGFNGDGYFCSDIDECSTDNGGCSTSPQVQCVNTLGSFYCDHCPPGYSGDGKVCKYQGICNVNNGGCHPSATCRNNPNISWNYVNCICPFGFTGSGIGPNGCIQLSTSPCQPNPCRYGTCSITNGRENYHCDCDQSYSGQNCDQLINACDSNPCQNGGTCISLVAPLAYRCACSAHYTGLRCEDERQSCGDRLLAPEGQLIFPSLNSQIYQQSMSCAWTIETNSTKILNLTFAKFNLEKSLDCQYDWLQIYDGKNTMARSLGRFCGNMLPNNGSIVSTHNIIYLWFRSDHSIADGGFQVNWTSITPVCGFNIFAESYGTVHSPGSPGNYPNNRDCFWMLHAPFGKRFQFHFFTLMIGDNPDCNSDYIEFISNDLLGNNVFQKFCNTSHPPPLFSPDSDVIIHFHSDAVNNHPGFQITYSVENGIPGCGGTFTADEGEIRSPTFDKIYPEICEYKIKVSQKNKIKIKFLSFSIRTSPNCIVDSLSIYSGGSKDHGLVARLCGDELPPNYVFDGNEILIVLKSVMTKSHGFVLNYEQICHEKFFEPSGVIASPNYPKKWHGKSCVFEIVQPIGTVIELVIHDLEVNDVVPHGSCFLEIRDGDTENSTLIGKFIFPPPAIISSYNFLWLKFQTESEINKEFFANYTTKKLGCGGILKSKIGTIASPNHPDHYASLSRCQWIISAPPGQVIQISFTMLHIEESYNCAYDFLELFDNNTESSYGGSMGKFCGHKTPPLLLSTSNIVTINFVSDSTVASDGFLATYSFINEANVCGGNYFSSAGEIKSPGYPKFYPLYIECLWTITVAPGHQIMLHVTNFTLDSHCGHNWLEIRNGGSASPLIGRYCGTDIPKLIPSHTNKLSIKFKALASSFKKLFKIYWDSTTTGCGGTLYAPTGSIISPNYPEPYYANTECIWKISINAGNRIQIFFLDLEIEQNSKCLMDYIEFFDGPTMSSKSLGKFCSTHPIYLNSTSNHLTIKFRSDVNQEGRGFQLQYNILCNVTIRGFNGVIESPNFPNFYPHNLKCNWNIRVDSRNKINITFSHYGMEYLRYNDSQTCAHNFLKIEQRPFTNTFNNLAPFETYGTYCKLKKVPEFMNLNSDDVLVRFVSSEKDGTLLRKFFGFRLEWTIDGCGGILTHPTGTIQSPNYPKPCKPSTECNWLIQANYGNSIEITFNDLDIKNKENHCINNGIMIYNGEDNTFPEIAEICHSTKPVTVSSSGNFMYIQFKSDGTTVMRGFSANYSNQPSKCGGKFTAKKGTITSPNYPKNYDHNDTCSYLIEVDESHTIRLKIEDFDLTFDVNCSDINSSYVKVFNGPSAAYPVLGKLCGRGVENTTFESTSNHMFVEFVSSTEMTAKGFKAKYELACGRRIETSESGVISISQHDFGNKSNCSWTIISNDPNKHVSLTISYFHRTYSSCEFMPSPLKIFNGETSDAPLLGDYCDDKLPPMVTSEGRALHVSVEEYINFFATYSVYDSACGGVLIANGGSFSSPGYPKRYPIDVQCEWTLSIPQGINVALYFKEFSLLESEHCNTDYLEIRKNNNSGNLLGIFCGTNRPENITSVSGNVWILLKTSHVEGDSTGIAQKGFLAEFIIDYTNELFGSRGIIESPDLIYIKYYLTDFTWKITVTFQKEILLTFKKFMIGSVTISGLCYDGVLQIYDGEDESYPSIGELCGNETPNPIRSSSNVIFIKASLHSFSITSGSFEIEWLEVENKVDESLSESKKNNCSLPEAINLNLLKNYTIISSPGYPNGYAENLNCEWIITTIPMNHLRLEFLAMDLEKVYYSSCISDYVQIFQKKTDSDWELISTYCFENATSQPLETVANLMKIVFISNGYVNETGFSAIIIEECGGHLNDPNGFIVFDNMTKYIGTYNKICEWNITVKAGKTIEVEFIKFNLLEDPIDRNCLNYVMLRNGNSRTSPFLGDGKFCGTQKPPLLKTIGNNLHVKFYGTVKSSFIMKYREIGVNCKNVITLTDFANSEQISSPNYPNIPQPHTECVWIIMSPPGETIRIDFTGRFDLFTDKDCTKEYVEIRDGGTVFSKLIGRFCKEMPSSQISADNFLFVKFFTDIDDPSNGFQANVSISKCGGTIRGHSGELQSPFFNQPNKYPIDYNCTWQFSAPKGHTMKIKFNALDLGNSLNCSGDDSVEISQENILPVGENLKINKKIILGKFCGKNLPETELETFQNQAIIHFKSGKEIRHYKGFSISFKTNPNNCGENIFQPSGFISTPNYPYPAENSRTCSWVITVPRGRRITLDIIDFDYSADSGIFLAFYNSPQNLLLASTDFNKSTLKTVTSSENTLYVLYKTEANNRRGFKAKYSSDMPTICQGDFNQTEGVLSQPEEILPSYTCTYIHDRYVLQTTLAINVKIYTKDAECKIYIGRVRFTTGNIVFQSSICSSGEITKRSVYPNNELKITSNFENQLNYTVSYKTYPCGGIRTKETDTISSPNFPNKYTDSLECSWLIDLPKEQTIQLTVTDLKLGHDCKLSYLDIYNGESPEHPKLGRYCQNNQPNIIKSETNNLWLDYKFDKESNAEGFSLKYEPIIQGCGGIFNDRSRIIQTPDYPTQYPDNAECLWELHSPQGYHIGLKFISRFEIEKSENCTKDFLEISDWRNDEWFSYGKQCGRKIKTFNSTSNKLKILFRSNDRNSGMGFRAQWEWNCGGEFIADGIERLITSPGYPTGYSSNLTCEYNITTSTISSINHYITIRFDDFFLEEGVNCQFDSLVISDTYNPPPYALSKTYCGKHKPPTIRIVKNIFLKLKTDFSFSERGFKFAYQVEDCGGNITEPTTIKSPLFNIAKNYFYNGYFDCLWNITAPKNKIIRIDFEYFKMQYQSTCYVNNIEIFDGKDTTHNALATICGDLTENPPAIVSTTNRIIVKSMLDRTVDQGGFKAMVFFTDGPEAGCGGVKDVNVTSPLNLSSPNLENLDCTWTILAPQDHYIKIELTELNLQSSCASGKKSNCSCSILEITDGHLIRNAPFERLCGIQTTNLQKNIFTSGNKASIRFFGRDMKKIGFRATISTSISVCGPSKLTPTTEIKTITSPNYPNTYPANTKCVWYLKGTQKVQIHFKTLDIERTPRCEGDRLEIIDVDTNGYYTSEENTVIGFRHNITDFQWYHAVYGIYKFCGNTENHTFEYFSNGYQVEIAFTSLSNPGKGFSLEYSLAVCTRNYTAEYGQIAISGTENCNITIKVPKNRTISIYFQQYVMYQSTNCDSVGLEIKDGISSNSTLLLKDCGYELPNPVFSISNEVSLRIWSNESPYPLDMVLFYTSTDAGRGCGGTLFNYRGRIYSPLYPAPYRSSTECVWNIRVTPGLRIALKFDVFDIQGDCSKNYVKVKTVADDSSPAAIQQFCNTDTPGTLYSAEWLTISYKSSLKNRGRGFLALFEAVTH